MGNMNAINNLGNLSIKNSIVQYKVSGSGSTFSSSGILDLHPDFEITELE